MIQAAHTLGIVFFPAYDWAISPTHPEREERLLYTQDQFREEGLFDIAGISEHRPLRATDQDILRTHFCFPNLAAVCSESHRISAGGAMRAAQLVLERQSERAFALVRPPGHHAMKVVHANRGFCNINNEAVMLAWLRRHYGLKRIATTVTAPRTSSGMTRTRCSSPCIRTAAPCIRAAAFPTRMAARRPGGAPSTSPCRR